MFLCRTPPRIVHRVSNSSEYYLTFNKLTTYCKNKTKQIYIFEYVNSILIWIITVTVVLLIYMLSINCLLNIAMNPYGEICYHHKILKVSAQNTYQFKKKYLLKLCFYHNWVLINEVQNSSTNESNRN